MTNPNEQLTGFRQRIDAIDDQLMALIEERTGIIREVAVLKQQHWPKACQIRPGREGQMHRRIYERFKDSDFSWKAAVSIWRQMIGASTHIESPLRPVVLLQPASLMALARDYFGAQVEPLQVETLEMALNAIASAKANLLVLPSPQQSDWWRQWQALEAQGLRIFALLPVYESAPEQAVALAALEPEPSGADVSYFVQENQLVIVEGFASAHEGATYLGTHPKPVG
jgi:chorismate mutase